MHKGIQNIFSSIPATYELANHILTLGFDTPIRRYTAKFAASDNSAFITHNSELPKWLDVCTGTGEMAHYLSKYNNSNTLIMASDFTLPMLRYAKSKNGSSTDFANADSLRLPFKDNTFDLVTISFATRNINVSRRNLIGCLKEFHRVLRPGGRFINLETSQPRLPLLRNLLHGFVRTFVSPIGAAISGSRPAYAYLSQTIPRFYDADELSEIILESGFAECNYKSLLGGLAAIHQGIKSDNR
ncbi:MAG: ubiquinone/menaquinone biosynthesis methyltransferase [Planctomycetes bacterium]|nr:ubiquinone/menaquinone biosynthesis methyltransferase [Planctomycetota bacterium]